MSTTDLAGAGNADAWGDVRQARINDRTDRRLQAQHQRITKLEKSQWFASGAIAAIGFMVGSGLIGWLVSLIAGKN